MTADLQSHCDLLRSLHRPGDPLLLPNAWDVATARAVVAAGFPVVATTSEAVAATLGYEDEERAPADEMLAAAGRMARSVEVPVTVDAEAGYGMDPADVVSALRSIGAAGCNLEDTDHTAGSLRDPNRHAEWLRAVRQAASDDGYPLVINARIDIFFWPYLAAEEAGVAADPGTQEELVPEALRARERLPRGRRGLRLPDLPLGDGRAAPLHVRGRRPGERCASAGGTVGRRAGRTRPRPFELGTAPALGRDGSLQGTARLASGVRMGRD